MTLKVGAGYKTYKLNIQHYNTVNTTRKKYTEKNTCIKHLFLSCEKLTHLHTIKHKNCNSCGYYFNHFDTSLFLLKLASSEIVVLAVLCDVHCRNTASLKVSGNINFFSFCLSLESCLEMYNTCMIN